MWSYEREAFQLQDVQQQIQIPQQRDLELASPSPFFLHEVWGSDLELASPGGFDSCIMDSSWTSSKELGTPAPPQGAAGVENNNPSPTSSAVSIRNLSHRMQQQQGGGDQHVDVSSASSVSDLLNRASISGGTGTSNKRASAEDSSQNNMHNNNNNNDESVGSPAIGFARRDYLAAAGAGGGASAGGDQNDMVDVSNAACRSRGPTERMMDITLEELSQYFTMPITQASKELKVGLTVLKKRCREFGIPRWPHRKLKSLESLIQKSQELAKDAEGKAPNPVIHAVQELEKQKKRMEESPGLELDDRTKRFRQAVFKAGYKQRRRAISQTSASTTDRNSNGDDDEQQEQPS